MKLTRENFLVQVKYADLAVNAEGIDKYFLGYGGELYLNTEEILNPDIRIVNRIKSFTRKNRLFLRLHAPIAEIDYFDIKSTILRLRSLYRRVFEFCRDLGIDSVVTHAEFDYKSDKPISKQFEAALKLWGVLSDDSKRNNITLNIENHYEPEPNFLLKLAREINSPYFGMCVDVGHFNAFSILGTKKWFEKYPRGSIREIHLADNKGDDDTHLPLGEGNIDFFEFFRVVSERKENVFFVLEPQNIKDAKTSINFLKKRGFLLE